MRRGLKGQGRDTFTEGDLRSVLQWGRRALIYQAIFNLVMKGSVDAMPSPHGDPGKVAFRVNSAAGSGRVAKAPARTRIRSGIGRSQ